MFIEHLNLVSGIEIGFGGVWVGAAPNLLFIPIAEGTDTPAGPPQVVLDGWGYEDTHETLNTFTWGPDGWLYGTHGVFTQSLVGKPGTPDSERVKLNAGVWRFHPVTRAFEVFAEGTSNPWGLDFNDYGHAFVTACVIEHLYQVVQGGRYKRQAGQHVNPNIYDDIKTVADHVHWVGNKGPHAGNSRSDAAGGGHAHAGAMIYLGGDNWPKEYRDAILMNNIHGARANMDRLQRQGSGYAAAHGPDFLKANDSWSQMLNFRYGPDGSVHVIDWYDKNQCHSSNPEVHDKTLGRIYKISHTGDKWVQVDLAKMTSEQLVDLQLQHNDWYVRHARRILQERGPDPKVHERLKRMLHDNPDVTRKLRALWALHVTKGLTERDLQELLTHESEYVRSWAVYLLVEGKNPSDGTIRLFAKMARDEKSALVRLYLASALQRTPPPKRWDVLTGLMAACRRRVRSESAADGLVCGRTGRRTRHAASADAGGRIEAAAAVSVHCSAHRGGWNTRRASNVDGSVGANRGCRRAPGTCERHHSDRRETVSERHLCAPARERRSALRRAHQRLLPGLERGHDRAPCAGAAKGRRSRRLACRGLEPILDCKFGACWRWDCGSSRIAAAGDDVR